MLIDNDFGMNGGAFFFDENARGVYFFVLQAANDYFANRIVPDLRDVGACSAQSADLRNHVAAAAARQKSSL
ncbi:hypothetical protein SDC9_58379 [bioreactor metagenome]|uniref:Uncharacterized protein n=1 Tax=bioreactor metagenome TaxID=1076179 RepID=A0A644X880_9ZZZZ